MKVLFQGIPTGLELAKEFKGSTTKKIDMHRKSSSGNFFMSPRMPGLKYRSHSTGQEYRSKLHR